MAAEAPEMIVPETKPKTIEYMINAALVVTEFRKKITMPVTMPPSANTFNRPYLSASTPGIIRPNVEAALIIASKYPASVGLIPLLTAYVGIKKSGVNMPMNMKNNERMRRTNLASL